MRDGRRPSVEKGYVHCGPAGAGRFVKMVHNGIEYGLMQAYAEGFDIFKNANSKELPEAHRYDLKHLIATICNSQVYSLSSLPSERNASDRQNYSRHYRTRLRAENRRIPGRLRLHDRRPG